MRDTAGELNRLYYCDHLEYPLPPGHKFPQAKYRLLRELLSKDLLFDFQPAPLATQQAILLAHEEKYVSGFLSGQISPEAIRRIGFPWSPQLVERTLASVGGTVQAADYALTHGWAGTLAGGTHHASRTEGAGFCVFNDIAVAVLNLQKQRRVGLIAVLDLDVHQGDGTASIFEKDPSVLTISLHGKNNFPFRKQISKIDIAFDDATGDQEFLTALDSVLPMLVSFQPEIVFYQSGVDALTEDTLGKLSLTREGLLRRDELVFRICRENGFPFVVTLGGGYAKPIEKTVEAHAGTFRTAARVFGEPTF